MSESLSNVPADLRLPITKVNATSVDSLTPLVALHEKVNTAIDKAIVERSLYKVPANLLVKAFALLLADNMRPANVIFGILGLSLYYLYISLNITNLSYSIQIEGRRTSTVVGHDCKVSKLT